MGDNQRPKSDREKELSRTEVSLQLYADTLAKIILAGRMCNGVTVALSAQNEDAKPGDEDAVLMASSTSIMGQQATQLDYGIVHMTTLGENAKTAVEEMSRALEEKKN